MYWIDQQRDWGPFAELRTLQREVNRLFNGTATDSTISRYPALNVWGNNEQILVRAKLPGVNPDELDITVVNNQLTIKGERKDDRPTEDAVCHRNERKTGQFVRTIRLPYTVQNDRVEATYRDGVLAIRLPREEANKPKRIEIKTS